MSRQRETNGSVSSVTSDWPALGVYFWCYGRPKKWLSPAHKKEEEGTRAILLAGGFNGVGSWIFCYPSVVKRRLQDQPVPLPGRRPIKYLGVVDCLHKCVREEGTRLLFLGLGAAVAGL